MSYKVSDNFIRFLLEKSGGFVSPELFESFLNEIELEAKKYHFTDSSEANLIRILSGMFDPISFILESTKYPHHIEIVIAIAANSNYLTDIVVRNPEFLYLLFDPRYLLKKITDDYLSDQINKRFTRAKSFHSKVNFLRLLKRRAMLVIGINDIMGTDEFEETVEQISTLARNILTNLFDLCYQETLAKFEIKSTRRQYCIVSLGKLGGNELNYSSDVDLIAFYDKNSKIGSKKDVEYYEVLTEAVQKFIGLSSDISASGFMYRIDFRLRPDGRNAPLCRTAGDYIRYYETRGEDWERQMLIKADYLCGSKKLYDELASYLNYFVFPSSFSSSPLEQIKKMKSNIEKRLAERENIKLFSGGIRDIEFALQALQLVNGGRYKEIQTRTSLKAIEKLTSRDLLSSTERKTLRDAYIFYRKIEHYLQLMNDSQTHDLPEKIEYQLKIAKYLGLKDANELHLQITNYRKAVRKIFQSVVSPGEFEKESSAFDIIKFSNKSRSEKNIQYLRTGAGLISQKEFDKTTIELYNKIEPELVKYLSQDLVPDLTLENFATIIRSTGFPSIWFREFSNPKFFHQFLMLCGYSQKSVELLINRKSLAEILITRKVFQKDASDILENCGTYEVLFFTLVQFTFGLIDHTKVSEYITSFISNTISRILDKYEFPTCTYFIAGMGSFGSKEMSFSSDIDLVFVTDNLSEYELIQNTFQSVLDEIKKTLKVFEIDCRLRPEGKKAPLVWTTKKYLEYLKNRARIWEFQSLLKINKVCGDQSLFDNFIKDISILMEKLDKNIIKKEIAAMLETLNKSVVSIGKPKINLKKSKGALSDIDFVISYLILSKNKNIIKYIGLNTLEKIALLSRSNPEIRTFKKNFNTLKQADFAVRNSLNITTSNLPSVSSDLDIPAKLLNINGTNKLTDTIQKVLAENLKIKNRIFETH